MSKFILGKSLSTQNHRNILLFYLRMLFLFIVCYSGWEMDMLHYVQTRKQITLQKSVTAYSQTTNTWMVLLSANRQHFSKTPPQWKPQPRRAWRFFWNKCSLLLHEQNKSHLTIGEKFVPKLSLTITAENSFIATVLYIFSPTAGRQCRRWAWGRYERHLSADL